MSGSTSRKQAEYSLFGHGHIAFFLELNFILVWVIPYQWQSTIYQNLYLITSA